ncbi:MAG: hypothetical protein ABIF18_00830 [archaeon]
MLKDCCNMDGWTIASCKVATIAFVIIVLKLWAGAMSWVHNTNIWWFVGIFVILVIKIGMGHGCCQCNVPKKVVKKVVKKKKR